MLGQANSSRIQAIEVRTVSIEHNIKKLLYQDTLGVTPTELCTCSEKTSSLSHCLIQLHWTMEESK